MENKSSLLSDQGTASVSVTPETDLNIVQIYLIIYFGSEFGVLPDEIRKEK